MVSALYHDAAGATHVLAAPLPEIIAALATPADIPALLATLGIDDDGDARDLLAARLAELRDIGVIVPA